MRMRIIEGLDHHVAMATCDDTKFTITLKKGSELTSLL